LIGRFKRLFNGQSVVSRWAARRRSGRTVAPRHATLATYLLLREALLPFQLEVDKEANKQEQQTIYNRRKVRPLWNRGDGEGGRRNERGQREGRKTVCGFVFERWQAQPDRRISFRALFFPRSRAKWASFGWL